VTIRLRILGMVALTTIASTLGRSQSSDFMPFAVGNTWTYSYYAYDDESLAVYRTLDTGIATVRITGRLVSADSTIWSFEETRDIVHNYNFWFPPQVDTSYIIRDTIQYQVIEYHQGDHRFFRTGYWTWASVFLMHQDFSDSVAFFRYRPDVLGDTLTVHAAVFVNQTFLVYALDVSFCQGVGLSELDLTTGQISGDYVHTHHLLRNSNVTNIRESLSPATPSQFVLDQNYPNPFNPATTISYSLSSRSNVSLVVYDVLGREIMSFLGSNIAPGRHTLVFDGSHLSSGVYYYMAHIGNWRESRRMLLLK